MFEELKDVRAAMAEFQKAKVLFDEVAKAAVVDSLGDSSKISALKAAQEMIRFAAEHHATVELAVKELLDPKTASEEAQRILAHANDHASELGKFLDEAKSLVGVEFEIAQEAIAAHAAGK